MQINGKNIPGLGRPFLIAEAGATHEGKAELALQMARKATGFGADALTYQEIDEEKLYARLDQLPVEPQPRVGWQCLGQCRNIAREAGLAFSVCVTDIDSLKQAMAIGIDFIKIVSYDISFFPFLKFCGETGLPVLMSTGASTFEEIEQALLVLNAPDRVLLYHTDCGYPTPDNEVNLRRMIKLRERFRTPVGYCDHTDHGVSCLAAAALGADAVEKHFTLDRSAGGDDYMVALEPDEIADVFEKIKRVSLILGNGSDKIQEGDLFRRSNLRRSVALSRSLKTGEPLTEEHLTMLRPPHGLGWEQRLQLLGRKSKGDLDARHILAADDLEA